MAWSKLIALMLATFTLGLILCRWIYGRSLKKLGNEKEELEWRLLQAGHLIGQKLYDEDIERTADLEIIANPKSREIHALTEKPLRRVQLTKVSAKGLEIKDQAPMVGLEIQPPEMGRGYRILNDSGRVFCTTKLTRINTDYIHTQNSVYKIDYLQEGFAEPTPPERPAC